MSNINESELPVNALSQLRLRRRKFQRRCSVTEHSLRAAQHVREILYREECTRRQPIGEQQEHHDSVPALVEAALVEAVADEHFPKRLPVRFFNLPEDGKCVNFQASWNTDKFVKPWQNNSLMALAAPFMLQEGQWAKYKTLTTSVGADRNPKRESRCSIETSDCDDRKTQERCNKKSRIE